MFTNYSAKEDSPYPCIAHSRDILLEDFANYFIEVEVEVEVDAHNQKIIKIIIV